MNEADTVQNERISKLEDKVNSLHGEVQALLARIDTLTTIGKGLLAGVSLMLGVDIIPMIQEVQ